MHCVGDCVPLRQPKIISFIIHHLATTADVNKELRLDYKTVIVQVRKCRLFVAYSNCRPGKSRGALPHATKGSAEPENTVHGCSGKVWTNAIKCLDILKCGQILLKC